MGQVAGKRGVDSSPSASSSFDPGRGEQEKERGGKKPKAYVVYSRECYVGGTDH